MSPRLWLIAGAVVAVLLGAGAIYLEGRSAGGKAQRVDPLGKSVEAQRSITDADAQGPLALLTTSIAGCAMAPSSACPREVEYSAEQQLRAAEELSLSARRHGARRDDAGPWAPQAAGRAYRGIRIDLEAHQHQLHYNYVRIHQILRVTPAMAAGVSKNLWSTDDVVAMIAQ